MNRVLQNNSEKLCLVTGATGMLGQSFVPRLLRARPEMGVICLIRGRIGLPASQRFTQLLMEWDIPEKDRERIHFVEGDVCETRLGMSDADYLFLSRNLDAVIHMAASIDFALPLEEARRYNVSSTENVITLCKAAKKHAEDFRLIHVSTAYVCGKRAGRLHEHAVTADEGYWNTYEQTKAEAEHLVHQAKADLPVTVFRPSQVLGESESGRVGRFFGFFEYVELGIRGKASVLIGNPGIRPDIVSSDYVSDGILALGFEQDTIGQTYHLAAGLEASVKLGDIVGMVVDEINAKAEGGKQIVHPLVVPENSIESSLSAQQKTDLGFSPQRILLTTYGPYLEYERDFDVADAHKKLAAKGVVLPNIASVIRRSTRFAVTARMKKRRQLLPA